MFVSFRPFYFVLDVQVSRCSRCFMFLNSLKMFVPLPESSCVRCFGLFWVVLGRFGCFMLPLAQKVSLVALGCFNLFLACLSLLCLAYCCSRFLLTFKLVHVVPSWSNLFLIVLGCFRLFELVSGRISCFAFSTVEVVRGGIKCFFYCFFVLSVVSNFIWLFGNVSNFQKVVLGCCAGLLGCLHRKVVLGCF